MADQTNQDIISDDQNFNIDIDKIYSDFIKEIDSIRSYTKLTTLDNAVDLDNSALKLQIEKSPQESRCHAFYRLIGLPVIAPDETLYSPGFFKADNGSIDALNNKKGIGKKIPNGVKNLHLLRENSSSIYEGIFATQSIDSSVLALSSVNIRLFSSSLPNTDDPFDTSNPKYTVAGEDPTNTAISSSELLNMVDENGTQISASSKGLQYAKFRSHIIKPLMVHAPIELAVLPASRRICVPFVANNADTLISNDVHARRPYIEFVCRSRFDGRNKLDSLSDAQKDIIEFIKVSDTFKDLPIIQSVSSGVGSPTDQAQFLKFFNIIRAMASQLFNAVNTIANVRSEFFWVPIPNKGGPEYGSTTRDIVPNDPNIQNNQFTKDSSIVQKIVKKRFEQITATLFNTQKDLNNYALQDIKVAPDNGAGLGNNNAEDLDNLIAERKSKCDKANAALREIEIIMGEFSGLGFCDIIAIYGALWLIDKKDLIGLLDENARARMKQVPELKQDPDLGSPSGSANAIKAFEKKIKELYELMDKAYQDILLNNGNAYTTQ